MGRCFPNDMYISSLYAYFYSSHVHVYSIVQKTCTPEASVDHEPEPRAILSSLWLPSSPQVKGSIAKASPYTACGHIHNAAQLRGRIALALRGDCMFAVKARRLQEAGATGVIVIGECSRSHFKTIK